jgi:hypothetical protein
MKREHKTVFCSGDVWFTVSTSENSKNKGQCSKNSHAVPLYDQSRLLVCNAFTKTKKPAFSQEANTVTIIIK